MFKCADDKDRLDWVEAIAACGAIKAARRAVCESPSTTEYVSVLTVAFIY